MKTTVPDGSEGLQIGVDLVPAYRAFPGGKALLGTPFLGAGHPAWRCPAQQRLNELLRLRRQERTYDGTHDDKPLICDRPARDAVQIQPTFTRF